ncbi:MAG: SDR family oxidoreductase [Spirochaetes bacterium]|jgi:short-subunit dehydrogenase|nr:SDR family oxidoreductase [Spirochaetota bacterium]
MRDFTNRMVFITGGSSGIGLATAELLFERGAHLVIFARDENKMKRAVARIEKRRRNQGQTIGTVRMDVTSARDVHGRIDRAVKSFGAPDLLIASAGIGAADVFENIRAEVFDAIMKTNVYGVRETVAAALPHMKAGGGHIVLLSSAAGLIGMYGYTAYAASKYAVVGLAECLRAELKRHRIGVSVVCPPEVETPFLEWETSTIPPETRMVKSFAGLLSPEIVARAVVKGIRRGKFLIIPGVMARLLYLSHRLTNGWATRVPSDAIAAFARWRADRTAK